MADQTTPAELPKEEARDMMAVFQDRVMKKLSSNPNVMKAMDPATWIGIGTALIEMFMECRKNRSKEQITAAMKNPNTIQKLRLRRGLIKQLGRKQVKTMEEPLVASIVDVARESSEKEINAFYDQVE